MENNTQNIPNQANLESDIILEDINIQADIENNDNSTENYCKQVTIANEHLMIGANTLLKDCSSVSQSFFGNFVGDNFFESNVSENNRSQVVLLRSNEMIELYRIVGNSQLDLITKYEVQAAKVSKMIVVRKPGTSKDMIVIEIPSLKFITLEIDDETLCFKTLCMHNFEDDLRLQQTGKHNARQGFLQPFFMLATPLSEDEQKNYHEGRGRPKKEKPVDLKDENPQFLAQHTLEQCNQISGFMFLADDTKVVFVQFKPQDTQPKLYYSQRSQKNEHAIFQKIQKFKNEGQGRLIQKELDSLINEKIQNNLDPNYMDVFVPQNFQEDKNSFLVSQKSDINEYLLSQLITAQDLLYPTEIYDLVTLKSVANPLIQKPLMDFQQNQEALISEIPHLQLSARQIYSIKDLRVLCQSSTSENTGSALSLMVLHQTNLDKCTGTYNKPPNMTLNIYEALPLRSFRTFAKQDKYPSENLTRTNLFTYRQQRPFSLKLVSKIEQLNHYTKLIIDQPKTQSNENQYANDLIYLVSNVSIYAFRQERDNVTEVQTSSIAKIVEDIVSGERFLEKRMDDINEEETRISRFKVKNVIDKKSLELKFDGSTRFHALSNNRLLLIMQNQEKYVIHFRLDDIQEVAAVDFVKIKDNISKQIPLSIIPSSISTLYIDTNENPLQPMHKNQHQFLIFVTSYFNDQYLLKLSPNFEIIDSTVDGQAIEKRQRTLSTDSQNLISFKKNKQKNQNYPVDYSFENLDQLTTVCPINNMIELPGNDILLTHGHFSQSQLTLIRGKESETIPAPLAVDMLQEMLVIPNINSVFSLSFNYNANNLRSLKQFIILSLSNSTQIYELDQGSLEEIKYENTGLISQQKTISMTKISEQIIMQATEDKVIFIQFDFETGIFKQIKCMEQSEQFNHQVIAVNQLEIIVVNDNGINQIIFDSEQKVIKEAIILKKTNGGLVVRMCDQILVVLDKNQQSILIYQQNNSSWVQVSSCTMIDQTPAFITNNPNLKQRSITDPSVTFKLETPSNQMSESKVIDMNILKINTKAFMCLVYQNANISMYEIETQQIQKRSFKLIKVINNPSEACATTDTQNQCIFIENNQMFVLYKNIQNLKAVSFECMVITIRKGQPYFNSLPKNQFSGIIGQTSIQAPIKPNSKIQISQQMSLYFLCILKQTDGSTSLCMAKHASAKVQQYFDIRQGSPLSQGILLKNYVFQKRGIKATCIHQNKYLVMATYENVDTVKAPSQFVTNKGWKPNLKNMAQDYKYQIELYMLPQIYHKSETIPTKQTWKDLDCLQQSQCKSIYSKSFQMDEVVCAMKSLTLQIQNQNELQDFIIVTTIKLDPALQKTQYSSFMYLFQITPDCQLDLVSKVESKRLINCLNSYRGKLLSVQKSKPDFEIIIETLKLNNQFIAGQQSAYSIEENKKYIIDKNQQQPQKNSIQNMASMISIDSDYIFVGDIYKNFQVFKLKDSNELREDKLENSDIITLKKRFQSKIDANCIGVWTFNKDNVPDLKHQTLLSASQDGYLRMYVIRGQKNVDCTASINIRDHILQIIPSINKTTNQRQFLVAPRHGGIMTVQSISTKKFKTLSLLINHMSQVLPWQGCIQPSMSAQIQSNRNLGIGPAFLACSKNMGIHFLNIERQVSNTLDCQRVIDQFIHLDLSIQTSIAQQIGFMKLSELFEVIMEK